ncbi:uncharacterized protein [Panulirus ornatus]|uniref:uncharacterized protein n=1 Tax=Panulirus ornatus TaxID=150431 RepID=UPI003A8B8628
MPTTLHASGKRLGWPSLVATAAGNKHRLLYSLYCHSGSHFLVDTGAEFSVFSSSGTDTRPGKKGPPLTDANGSNGRTYRVHTITRNFNICRFKWTFTNADVSQPMPGADFLRAHSLLVDVKGRLLDIETFDSVTLRHAVLIAPNLDLVTSITISKTSGGWKPCGDYHRLDEVTTADWYPVTRIQLLTANLNGAKGFSKVDLLRGYHQLPVHSDDIPKTVIIIPFSPLNAFRPKEHCPSFPTANGQSGPLLAGMPCTRPAVQPEAL